MEYLIIVIIAVLIYLIIRTQNTYTVAKRNYEESLKQHDEQFQQDCLMRYRSAKSNRIAVPVAAVFMIAVAIYFYIDYYG